MTFQLKFLAALLVTALSLTVLAEVAPNRGIDIQTMSTPRGTILSYINGHTPQATNACYGHTTATSEAYTCLSQALKTSGLDKILASQGTFTLFAPNDEAFKTLAATMTHSSFTSLMNNPAQLKAILSYHVLPEENTLSSLYAGAGALGISEKTLQGSDVTVNFADASSNSSGKVISLGQNIYVTATTISTDNGTVIGIDHVLSPHALN